MAFSSANLTRIGGASNGDLWYYSSADAIATVRASGYFNDASNMLAVRDLIIVVDTNTPTTHFCNVLSNASGVVDVSAGTAVAETDTD